MSVQITDAGNTLKIVEGSSGSYRSKSKLTISYRGDYVFIGESDSAPEFTFLFSDVTEPAEASAEDLAETLNGYIPESSGGGGSEVSNPTYQGYLDDTDNWETNGEYSGPAITAAAGSYYVTPDTGTNTRYYFKFHQANTPVRVPFTNVLLNE